VRLKESPPRFAAASGVAFCQFAGFTPPSFVPQNAVTSAVMSHGKSNWPLSVARLVLISVAPFGLLTTGNKNGAFERNSSLNSPINSKGISLNVGRSSYTRESSFSRRSFAASAMKPGSVV